MPSVSFQHIVNLFLAFPKVAQYIEAQGYIPRNAVPADVEVDGEMNEVLDYIEANSYGPRRAVPASVEVESEMDEVLDYIEASSFTPRRAMPVSSEVDQEIGEVLDEIDSTSEQRWANPFNGMWPQTYRTGRPGGRRK